MSADIDLQEGEKALIGAISLAWGTVEEYKTDLLPEDFEDKRCRDCWQEFIHASCWDDWLKALSAKRLVSFASNCMDTKMPMSGVPWLVGKIKRAAQKRRLQQGIRDIWQWSEDDLLERLSQLVDRERRNDLVHDDDLPAKLHAETLAEVKNNDLSSRISTGIISLDRIVQGLRLGNVSVLGAEPSTGKTAFALNVAAMAVSQRKKVVIFSLEMSAVQMMDRMIASSGNIPYGAINNKSLSDEQLKRFEEVSYSLTSADLLYIYDTIYSIERMGAVLAKVKPDLVIVDFLQFCRTQEATQSTADRLEYIVSEFKRLAKIEYHKCHIMLLSQPSRQATKEGQSMFALKGSSGIEQGGDVILLLDRPCVRDMTYAPEQAQVKIAKNKFGRTGLIDLCFEGEYQRFRDLRKGEVFDRVDPKEDRPW